MKCSDSGGIYIIRIKIHLDEITLYKIVGLEKADNTFEEKNTREIAKNYLNRIFNDMNHELDRYGVQVEGDYSFLHFDELDLDIDMEKICTQKMVATLLTQVLTPKLSYPETDGLGLRIVGISCKVFTPEQIPFFTIPNGGCGHIATIFVLDPFTIEPQIKLLVRGFITNGIGMSTPLPTTSFKDSLCRFSKRCTKNNDAFGILKHDISRIKHKMYEEPLEESSHSDTRMFNLKY